MKITITLPLPHPDLSPNARVHWTARSQHVKIARKDAYHMTCKAGGKGLGWKSAAVQAVFYHPIRRYRDGDNLLSSLKAYFDGIAEAGLVVDDCGLTHLPMQLEIDTENPRVELTFERTE